MVKKNKCKFGMQKTSGKCPLIGKSKNEVRYNNALDFGRCFEQFKSIRELKNNQKEFGGKIVKRRKGESQDDFFNRLRGCKK